MANELTLSTLGHTWIFDLDGTIVKHNGYKIDGFDTFLPGAEEFLLNIPAKDIIIFITARESKYRDITEEFLRTNNIRYDHIIFEAPNGERISINDCKPSGLKMCYAVNVNRDQAFDIKFVENPEI